jgi:hypothetical protein
MGLLIEWSKDMAKKTKTTDDGQATLNLPDPPARIDATVIKRGDERRYLIPDRNYGSMWFDTEAAMTKAMANRFPGAVIANREAEPADDAPDVEVERMAAESPAAEPERRADAA